jgi:hypothetical protein
LEKSEPGRTGVLECALLEQDAVPVVNAHDGTVVSDA